MADIKTKWKQNLAGKYFVDETCIACDACVVEAPKFFAMNDEDGHAYVFKQPESKSDLEDCANALATCPVEAIGNNGD